MPTKIAMVGTAASGKHAPWNDSSYKIWGVSSRAVYVTRADRWFELHNLNGEPQEWADQWRAILKTSMVGVPIYMLYPEPDLGEVVRYPHEEIVERFGTFFMQSTFSWMMALAIHELAPPGQFAEPGTEIAIFGVDMEYGTEYVSQRHGFRHFVEVAKALGIRVTRLTSSGMSYEPVPYPMIQDDPLLAKLEMRSADVHNNLVTLNSSLLAAQDMRATIRGSLNVLAQIGTEGFDPVAQRKALESQFDSTDTLIQKLSKDMVANEAIASEQNWLKDYLSP